MEIGTASCCRDKTVPYFSRSLSTLDWENVHKISYQVAAWNLRTSYKKLAHKHEVCDRKHHRMSRSVLRRVYSMPVSVAEDHVVDAEDDSEKILSQPLSNDELMSLLADSERQKLMIKLSEANQQNMFLKRQLHIKEDALVKFKGELAVMELEIQPLVSLAKEIAQPGIPEGSRKINGKFIQSHLHSRLEEHVDTKTAIQIQSHE